MSTIFAPSTSIGGAIAIIRVSGPRALFAARTLCSVPLRPRMMTRAALQFEERPLDDAMVVFFPAPHSYTGEDMLELHCHGGQAVIRSVCAALREMGLIPAQAGEFSRRAFINGKMDLTQAEAVMDLIQSEAEQSARAALEQVRGRLKEDILHAEELLYDALSKMDAAIDYPDEMEDEVFSELPSQLSEAAAKLQRLIQEGMTGRILREGFQVAIIGAPNAGKSSLLNALLGYDRAIVTQSAGTTRDLLHETLSIGGAPVVLTDTAGLREAEEEAERIGISRAKTAIAHADALLLLLDGAAPLPLDLIASLEHTHKPLLLLRTKADLPYAWDWDDCPIKGKTLSVSVKTGEGLSALRDTLSEWIGPVGGVYVTNERHILAMQEAYTAITAAQNALDPDCASTDIRDALSDLGSITGRAVDDEVIDRIFSRFCVGK